MAITNKTGSPVSGDDFFDREWEFEQLLKAVRAGDSLLLSAARRVGKSSLMKKALNWARENEMAAVDIDVQHCKNEADFVEKIVAGFEEAGIRQNLAEDLKEKITDLKGWLAGSKLKAGGVGIEIGKNTPQEWEDAAKLLEDALSQLGEGRRGVLVGMDELPIFLARVHKNDPEAGQLRVDLVLHWLRSLRQGQKNVTWIICGSIGLDTFAAQHNLAGTINDLRLLPLGAFSEKTAREFLHLLGASPVNPLPMNDAVIDSIIERVGWPLPYFLQLVFQTLDELPPDQRTENYPSPNDVHSACDSLLSATYSKYFVHWVTRLDDQLPKSKAEAAEYLLNRLCRHKRGLSRNKLFQLLVSRSPESDPEDLEKLLSFLLDMLERDGYLQRENSIYIFRSFLLRDFWKRRTN